MEGTLRRVRSPPAALWTETLDNLWRINWFLRSFFPLGPPSCGDECRAERALGCGGIFPRGQQAVRRVRKRRREGNARAARNGFGSRVGYTIQTCDPSVSRTAVRWGPRFSSSAPPRSPAPSFDHFPFGPRPCLYLDDDDKNCQQRNYSCMITRLVCLTILRNVETSEISLTNQ